MSTEELKIVTANPPIVKDRIDEVTQKVEQRIEALNIASLIATEDTVTALKKVKAELSNEFKQFEDQRKAVKNYILEPYNLFEIKYSRIKKLYANADLELKKKIEGVEIEILRNKKEELEKYYKELQVSRDLNWLSFEQLNIKILLSISLKKYKERILETVDKVKRDLNLIDTETYQAEIQVLYKKNLDVAKSIQEIRQRKLEEKAEKERILNQRTDKRKAELRSFGFTYSDLLRSFCHINNNDLLITLQEIEEVDNSQWEIRIEDLKKSLVSEKSIEATEPIEPAIFIGTN